MAQGAGTKIWTKAVARRSWEELGDWDLLVPAAAAIRAGGGGGGGDQDMMETRMWRVEVSLEEMAACLGGAGTGAGEVLGRWCREF